MARSFAGGSTDNLIVNNPAGVGFWNIGTVAWWYKPGWNSGDSLTHGMWTWEAAVGGNHPQMQCFHFAGDNNVYVGFQNNVDGSGRINVIDTGFFTSGTWVHQVYRWNSTNTTSAYFVNGVQKVSSVTEPIVAFVQAWTDFQLLVTNVTCAYSDYCGWNVNLTQSEINALVAGVRPNTIRPANILFYTPLDGLASPEPDYSGLKSSLTLTGTSFAPGPAVNLLTPLRPETEPATFAPALPLMPSMPDLTTPVRFRTRMVGY